MKFFSVIFFFVFIVMASSASFRNDGTQCAIPFILSPVCGTDGVTYDNNWALECEQKKNPGLRKKHQGPC
ncbi:UNVERIFIED_CONTAM: hypothetical protein RMT77_012264 [Armadillidium vulgare]